MGLSGSGINEENHMVNGSWIALLIDDSIGAILSVPFCLYHFVPYHFVQEPSFLFLHYHYYIRWLVVSWCLASFTVDAWNTSLPLHVHNSPQSTSGS